MSDHSEPIFNAPSTLRSKVWKTFGFFKKEGKLDKSEAVCKICRAAIKYTGSTTNLSTNISRRHASDVELDASTASTSSSTSITPDYRNITQFLTQSQLSYNSARAKSITMRVARFIAMDLRPYSVVENDGFRELLRAVVLKLFTMSTTIEMIWLSKYHRN